MPRGNGNGPMGMGPMTGRGMGYCAGNAEPGYKYQNGFGNNYGCGRGYHHGNRNMFYATGRPRWARYWAPVNAGEQAANDEKTFLKNQAAFLKEQLDQVNSRLSGLDDDKNTD